MMILELVVHCDDWSGERPIVVDFLQPACEVGNDYPEKEHPKKLGRSRDRGKCNLLT